MKTVLKDYFISLGMAIAFVLNIAMYIGFSDQRLTLADDDGLESYFDESETIQESILARRSPVEYTLDSSSSKIFPKKFMPERSIWVERNSLGFYRRDESYILKRVSDSLLNDFIVHAGKMNDHDYGRFLSVWIDKSDQSELGSSWTGSIQFVEKCPDTLILQMGANELVNKGELWIVEEK